MVVVVVVVGVWRGGGGGVWGVWGAGHVLQGIRAPILGVRHIFGFSLVADQI